jgi:hypothetical protein
VELIKDVACSLELRAESIELRCINEDYAAVAVTDRRACKQGGRELHVRARQGARSGAER